MFQEQVSVVVSAPALTVVFSEMELPQSLLKTRYQDLSLPHSAPCLTALTQPQC